MNSVPWNHLLAVWLGLLCAASPCPMATNLAAVGFLARDCGRRRAVLLSGVLYALGRAFAYVAVGAVLAAGMAAAPGLSHFLQKYMTLLMGPMLVLVSLPLLDLVTIPWPKVSGDGFAKRIAANGGAFGSFLLGVLFALSFCPSSAALFFGRLLPMTLSTGCHLTLPLAFGFATAFPVLLGAFLLAFCASRLGGVFGRVAAAEVWLRRLTGTAFLLIGLWMTCAVTLTG